MSIILLDDSNFKSPIPVSSVTDLDLGFKEFNPPQSVFVQNELHKKDVNLLICWETSTGKTVVAELVTEQALKKGQKIIYACPLKSLAEEKINRFKKLFPQHQIEIFTGDYQNFEQRKIKAQNADVAIVTTELLDSISRNKKMSDYLLNNAYAIILDEAHILATDRGAAAEGTLLRTAINYSDIRFVLLSATIPNYSEIGKWLYSLNQKNTYVANSSYRPVKINWNILPIKPSRPYGLFKTILSNTVRDEIYSILDREPSSQILVFVWTKKDGLKLQELLKEYGVKSLFHNASLQLSDRLDFEKQFEQREIQVLISTTTLAWGKNTCAEYVFIVGDKRGLERVPGWDVLQMGGRAGRTGLSNKAEVYWFVSNKDEAIKVFVNPPEVISSLKDPFNLAFQMLAEIPYNQTIDLDIISDWFFCTLAGWQCNNYERNKILNSALDILINKTGCVIFDSETQELKLSHLGNIAKRFYLHPFEISSLLKTINKLEEIDLLDEEEIKKPAITFAILLSHCNTKNDLYISTEELLSLVTYTDPLFSKIQANNIFKDNVHKFLTWKAVEWYKRQLGTEKNVYPDYRLRNFLLDFDRIGLVCSCILKEIKRLNGLGEEFQKVVLALKYGAPIKVSDLLSVPGIGKVRALKLFNAGITSVQELKNAVLSRQEKIFKILPQSVIQSFYYQ